jgi:metal-responsive CopG/Arc/MetJ family transcriptional regulator
MEKTPKKELEKIATSVSFNPDVLEALDKVAAVAMVSRSAYIQKCLQADPDIYDVLEGMKQ